ncbi:MAG: FkbM family methyltransferase, partial [Pedobacter sp.]
MNIDASIESVSKISAIANELIGHEKINVIFEFGSRYGEDSIAFAKLYPSGTIYSFECNPNTLAECRRNVKPYQNIVLTEKAVSDVNGTVSFFKIDKDKTETSWEDGNQGASSLFEASGNYPVENYVQEKVDVESVTLYSFISDNKIE